MVSNEGGRWDVGVKDNAVNLERILRATSGYSTIYWPRRRPVNSLGS